MKAETFSISLNFNQILDLVRQLPIKEKIKLSKELEKEAINSQLTTILTAFNTNELDEDTINEEVEAVRTDLYAKEK
ncbi:type II toxin-antitoxin system VapB15 family antitoxin [Solitalea canadensis]|uniref:Uncharacterized protein n=1 Tax=Solitalea canadensis (strain ATCC 29591 / DSM 3403 / JCM 21819 / LMG 8368 / NBRC 15130 / NCIMB 12057 / USAM 9D) TaxID=929556 RepID=H8KQ94_SOLCM|nr:hypothetical protein [Solitalea canadensis]AFD06389.1 hypothetical protein Solca_1300 [Solitalea canadensis DSM 3403]